MLVTKVTDLARGRVVVALGARHTAVGVEDGAGGVAIVVGDAAGVEAVS